MLSPVVPAAVQATRRSSATVTPKPGRKPYTNGAQI